MIKRAHLRQFLAVVETGNFTRAAQRINLSQPTLSVGIAELERSVGTPLFVRERRRVRLTDAGTRFLSHARAIEREFLLAEASLAETPVPAAPVRLGVIASLSSAMLGQVVTAYEGTAPLELAEGSEAEVRLWLREGKVDLALTILRPQDGAARALRLFEEGYRMMLPAGHRLAGAGLIDASDVAADTMIARRSCEILSETSRFFTQRGVRPRFALRSAHDDRCMEMVRAGLGVTTAPDSLVREGVVAAALAGYDFTRAIGLVFRADWLEAQVEEHPLITACRVLDQSNT